MKHERNILKQKLHKFAGIRKGMVIGMTKGRRLYRMLLAASLCAVMAGNTGMTAMASSTDYLDSLSTGVSSVLDGEQLTAKAETESVSANDTILLGGLDKKEEKSEGDFSILQGNSLISVDKKTTEKEKTAEELPKEPVTKTSKPEEEKITDGGEKGTVVMANVKNSVNVRAKADEDSEKVGYLYADCGGKILDRKDGWTKLESGKLTGWVKDEYLVFGKAAEEMAGEVGNLIVTIKADALRVRKEPDENSSVYGVIAKDDELDVIEELDGWVSVQYGDKTGYVSEEYVDADFHIDCGETIEEIREREKKEAAERAKLEKAKLTENRGAVTADVSDEMLLAALIQCEAGNQPYEGQLAVGAVVMNRVRSGGYPSSINGVIYASGQFTPALNGKVARVAEGGNIKGSCMQAAQEAIAGASNVGGATHFRRAGSRDGIVIGSHVFW